MTELKTHLSMGQNPIRSVVTSVQWHDSQIFNIQIF